MMDELWLVPPRLSAVVRCFEAVGSAFSSDKHSSSRSKRGTSSTKSTPCMWEAGGGGGGASRNEPKCLLLYCTHLTPIIYHCLLLANALAIFCSEILQTRSSPVRKRVSSPHSAGFLFQPTSRNRYSPALTDGTTTVSSSILGRDPDVCTEV